VALLAASLGLAMVAPRPAFAQSPLPDDFNPNANSTVNCAVPQTDGSVVVGGAFTSLGGQVRNRLARILPDGGLDAQFNPNAGGTVNCVVLQPDGRLVVGGAFTTAGGQTRNRLARFEPDGSLDAAFDPNAGGAVNCLAIQPDGRILVGGDFTALGGQTRHRLARLDADGTLDADFNPGANGGVNSIVVQPDGEILVGGAFGTLGGQTRKYLARVDSAGALDGSFNPASGGAVNCLLLQPDGGIVLGGAFTTLGGQTRNRLGRVDATGSLDPGFNPNAGGTVFTLVLQTDGRILVGGAFTTLGGQTRNRIARLNSDGTLDAAFDPEANGGVNSLCVQADGKILVGGAFSKLGDQTRSRLARLHNTEPAVQSLTRADHTITWLRGATSPEAGRTAFETWTGGDAWAFLGAGERIAGGWQLAGLSLPAGATIRARGEVSGGQYNGSAGWVETVIGQPVVLAQPASRTNALATAATFSVRAGGTEPLAYQWLKGGTPLPDGGKVSGATTPLLSITNVFGPDGGGYSVRVSNAFGSVTSAAASLTVIEPVIITHPVSQSIEVGGSATLTAEAGGTPPFDYQWRKDGLPLEWGTAQVLTVTNAWATDAGRYEVVVRNPYGVATSQTALLSVNAVTVDDEFDVDANSHVNCAIPQLAGQIVAGGSFNYLGGQMRNRLARLHDDGRVDSLFDPNADSSVTCALMRPDGGVLVGGWFTAIAGQARDRLALLNPNGGADGSFRPEVNGTVHCLAQQPDGRILIGGDFTVVTGQTRNRLARFEPNGNLDTDFNPGASQAVHSLAVQPDGTVVVGGAFTSLAGQTRNRVGRVLPSGSLDTAFNPNANGTVYCVLVQPDGRILLGGDFSSVAGQSRNRMARLLPDGSLDASFDPTVGGTVHTMALQSDGRILLGGSFATVSSLPRRTMARLYQDGSLDPTFNPGSSDSSTVYSLVVQANGQILAAGYFGATGTAARQRIARLSNTAEAVQSLTREDDSITWLRGGASPEVWHTVFEVSTNGIDWAFIGAGTRINGGWRLSAVQLPTLASVRVSGSVTGGRNNGSAWLVECLSGLPAISSSPTSRTNAAGTTAEFAVAAGGTGPLNYQWLKDGVPLQDAGNVSGARSSQLTLREVTGADAGAYAARVSNAQGSVTSAAAVLTVLDPVITEHPSDRYVSQGATAEFSVSGRGTAPLHYQWRKDGLPLPSGTASLLRVTNAQGADVGYYDAIVSNVFGVATSRAALLTVNLAATDATFNPQVNGTINCAVPQPDGKTLLGGYFTLVGGQPRTNLARLNAEGSVDAAFAPQGNGLVSCLLMQSDMRILVGGNFTAINGQIRNRLARLHTDGSLDAAYVPSADGAVLALALQPDGKALVGGTFSTLNGQSRQRLARLLPDGQLDAAFGPQVAGATVLTLAVQPDGKILVGGTFTTLDGQNRNGLGRLHADGTLDTTFDPKADGGNVCALALQNDGKILIGGNFTVLGGLPRLRVGRLLDDGTLDSAFAPTANAEVSSLMLQADGAILVGGTFTNVSGLTRHRIARLNPGGELDPSFNPGAKSHPSITTTSVRSLALQADGKVLVAGAFSGVGTGTSFYLARLHNTAPAVESLSCESSTVTWLRSGTGPEIWRSFFETSINGTDWTLLGNGERIPGGWRLAGVAVPSNASLRARGHAVGSYYNGSGWLVENLSGAPVVTEPPSHRTDEAGTTAFFRVTVGGSSPFRYQWLKDGVPLADGAKVSGAQTPVLTVSNVVWADGGVYAVRISNASGSVTSPAAVLTVIDPAIATHPVSQAVQRGQGVAFSVTARGTEPLHYLWRKDGSGLTWATDSTLTLTNVQGADAGNYDVVVSNTFGCTTSTVALLTVNLATLDNGFTPGVSGPLGRSAVLTTVAQPDGAIVVGGSFSTVGGQTRKNLARVYQDGTFDPVFAPAVEGEMLPPEPGFPPVPDFSYVAALAQQMDGSILVGGDFAKLAGEPRQHLGRLLADGTLDVGFNPNVDNPVRTLLVQPDSKILVGGDFTQLDGQPRQRIGRLHPDGTLDTAFDPHAGNLVYALALQPDGKILAGGAFTTLGGQPRQKIGRLHPDGMLDSGFEPAADNTVTCLAVQADGKILVGGTFSMLGGQARSRLGRLLPDGTLDTSFSPEAQGDVESLVVQADGQIVVGGYFSSLAGQPRLRLGRLHADGRLDSTFNPGVDGVVASLAVQADGRILVGGQFGGLAGTPRSLLGRLENTHAARQELVRDGTTLTWLRSGSGPEVWRASFHASANGADWLALGEGERVPGGWRLTGVSVAPAWQLRACGQAVGGQYNGSTWFVETFSGAPVILGQPRSRTVNAGASTTFQVEASGTAPLSYQWLKNGTPLTDGGSVSGAQTTTLILDNLLGGEAGTYSVRVSNAFGSVTSAAATLTVNDPVIIAQPISQQVDRGQNATFGVGAAGTAPFDFQWLKDGVPLPGETRGTLTVSNAQATDVGQYSVVVRTVFGSVTSATATLSVNLAALETAFDPRPDNEVYALAIQPDGRILIGGAFESLGGQLRAYLARLNQDGSLDSVFNPGPDAPVCAVLVQPDGRILIGGAFEEVGSKPRAYLARLNSDGSVDASFALDADDWVRCLALQPNGRVLVAGDFWEIGGEARYSMARLNPDGSLDASLTPGFNDCVYTLAVHPDGGILAGGLFWEVNGQSRDYIARLNPDGTVDGSFNPGANFSVSSLAVQADGRILVGGTFTKLGDQTRYHLGRLHPDGTVDAGFNPQPSSWVASIAVQADGKIVVGGRFTTLGGQPRNRLGRLNADGSTDVLFNPQANDDVYALALQADGALLVGGAFAAMGGQDRTYLGRIEPTEPATQDLTIDGATVTWLRGGSSPEVWRTTFETSTDGVNWSLLGAGTRLSGGWQLGGLSLPPDPWIRARGHVTGGEGNGSGWLVESLLTPGGPTPLRILVDDSWFGVRSNRFGFHLSGEAGRRVVVESSIDLREWTGLWTNTLSQTSLYFSDANWAAWTQGFYRARLLP